MNKNGCPLNAPNGANYIAGWGTRKKARRDKKDADVGDEDNGPFRVVKYVPSE